MTLLTALSFSCSAMAFDDGHSILGLLCVAAGILVIVYGVYFLRKLKKVSFL